MNNENGTLVSNEILSFLVTLAVYNTQAKAIPVVIYTLGHTYVGTGNIFNVASNSNEYIKGL